MTKKKDGITDLTKVLVLLARKFSKKDYDLITNTMFSLKMGINFGYKDEFDPAMLNDALHIYKIHHNKKQPEAKIFKLKLVKSSKDTNVKL